MIAFDKTGTLTYGTPEVVKAASLSDAFCPRRMCTGWPLLPSSFPSTRWAKPLWRATEKRAGTALPPAEAFQMIPGRGVCAQVDGQGRSGGQPGAAAGAGHADDASRQRRKTLSEQGCTVIYVAVDGALAGYLALSDTLRQESAATIDALSAAGRSARAADRRP